MSVCSSDTISKMEVWALLKLHETTTIPTLLSNCETWVLGKEQHKQLERQELWALKKLFGLPPTTPNSAVMLLSGCLYTTQRIHQKQLLYLKTILSRPNDDWTKISLQIQESEKLWWAKQIEDTLKQYSIDLTWHEIKAMPFAEWKRLVKTKIEEKYIQRMKEGYQGSQGEKTKTKFIKNIIENNAYERKPMAHIMEGRSKTGARALIMGISGMLDCANNFHFKYERRNCNDCGVIDDESHRINYCKKYEAYNLYHSHTKYDFIFYESGCFRSN